MPFLTEYKGTFSFCVTVFAVFFATAGHAVMDPRFELDTQTLDGPKSPAKQIRKSERRIVRTHISESYEDSSRQGSVYTVKQGDHLFKILMRDYGLTNDEADALIDKIRHENNIHDIRRLRVGQKIIIPPLHKHEVAKSRHTRVVNDSIEAKEAKDTSAASQTFRLESPVVALSEQETVTRLKEAWDNIVPSNNSVLKPLTIQSPTFSLTLDPNRYPIFATLDGARILLDQNATIPPLVKSLIEEKDPTVRIVSESPANAKSFLAAMLGAAGFYSVEENFNLQFGADPKLTVYSDFKIEKTPESVIKQDVVLLNCSQAALPMPLDEFLKNEGFKVYEPFALAKTFPADNPTQRIFQIVSNDQSGIVAEVLNALEISYRNDRHIDVFATDNNGISLSVKAERYFERDGQRFVITSFDGDPVTYTLFRILETKGYKVIMLEKQDDFRKVSEKILSRLHIQGGYAQHNIGPGKVSNYSLQMSGFKLEGTGVPGGSIFLTNLTLDRIIRDLLKENGYSVHVK